MDWNVLRNDWEQACSRRGESATVSTVDTLSSVFREIAGARELSGISKESVEVNDVELFAADEFVDQLKEMRSYGIDGRPIVPVSYTHLTLPTTAYV